MNNLLERYLLPVRSPDDPAGDPPANPGGDPPGGGSPDGGDPANPAGDPPPASPGDPADPAAAQPYRPEGLPDTMFGKDDRETMDKMATALKGYRQNDSQVGKDPDAYKAFDLDKLEIADDLKPHMDGLAKDPIMDAAAKYAHENKMPVPLVQGLVATVYGEAMKAGVFESFVDVKAERAALLPETAKDAAPEQQEAAIEARLKANEDWVKLNTRSDQNPNGMPQEVADHMLLMLMDTAKGNQAIEWVKNKITGGDGAGPIAGDGGQGPGAQNAREQLKARMAAPEMQAGHPKFDQAKWQQLQDEYKKLIGD